MLETNLKHILECCVIIFSAIVYFCLNFLILHVAYLLAFSSLCLCNKTLNILALGKFNKSLGFDTGILRVRILHTIPEPTKPTAIPGTH